MSLTLVLPDDADAKRFRPGNETIAEIAVGSEDFTTLVAALSCTGLVPAVADPDARLTVFAPTDAAFAAAGLDETNVCSTFDNATLTTILLYHVTEGRRVSPGVINGRNKQITMLAGGTIRPWGSGSLVIDANNSSATIVPKGMSVGAPPRPLLLRAYSIAKGVSTPSTRRTSTASISYPRLGISEP